MSDDTTMQRRVEAIREGVVLSLPGDGREGVAAPYGAALALAEHVSRGAPGACHELSSVDLYGGGRRHPLTRRTLGTWCIAPIEGMDGFALGSVSTFAKERGDLLGADHFAVRPGDVAATLRQVLAETGHDEDVALWLAVTPAGAGGWRGWFLTPEPCDPLDFLDAESAMTGSLRLTTARAFLAATNTLAPTPCPRGRIPKRA